MDNKELTDLIIKEEDPDKSKSLINLFNLHMAKQNALRLEAINGLIDNTIDNIKERLENKSDEFTNKDLIDYLNALYGAAEKSSKSINDINNSPSIVVNNIGQVNINQEDNLSRESKAKIAEAIKAILKQQQSNTLEIENNEITEVVKDE